jgi:hypothetical protein
MINYLKNFWNGLCLRQKIIITIYFVISLPLIPIVCPMWWFAKWVNQAKDVNHFDPIEYLSLSMAMTLMTGIVFALIHWLT